MIIKCRLIDNAYYFYDVISEHELVLEYSLLGDQKKNFTKQQFLDGILHMKGAWFCNNERWFWFNDKYKEFKISSFSEVSRYVRKSEEYKKYFREFKLKRILK